MEVLRVTAVFLKMLAEIEYKVVDSACGGVYVVAPYYLQNMLARYYLALVLYQQFQQSGLFFT